MNGYSHIGHTGFTSLEALVALHDTTQDGWVHGPINPLWLTVIKASANTLRINRIPGGGQACVKWTHAKGTGYAPNIRYALHAAWQALKN
jgi:hypothetical protein